MLDRPLREWIDQALSVSGLRLVELTPGVTRMCGRSGRHEGRRSTRARFFPTRTREYSKDIAVGGQAVRPITLRLRIPRANQCRFDRVRLKRYVRHECKVTAARAVGRLTLRFLEVSVHRSGVERIQNSAVMKQRLPAAPLCVPGNFLLSEGQVALSPNRQPRQLKGLDDPSQNHPVTLGHVSELGTHLERQYQRIVEAASRDDNRSSARRASDDRHAIAKAGVFLNLPGNVTERSDDDRRRVAFPESERLSGPGRFQGVKERSVERDVVVRISGVSVDQHEEASVGDAGDAKNDEAA